MATKTLDRAANRLRQLVLGVSPDEIQKNDLKDKEYAESVKRSFEISVVNDIVGRYEERKLQRRNIELQWRLNIAFYNGDQYTEIDGYYGDVVDIPALTDWEERAVYNEIAPNVETKLAIMNRRRNNMKCTPASSSSEDRSAAKVGDKVIASARRRLGLPKKMQRANFFAQILGTAVGKTVWDSSLGRTVAYDIRALSDEEKLNLAPEYNYEKELLGKDKDKVTTAIKEGDVDISIIIPFEIFPENLALPCDSQRRIMHVQLLSPSIVNEKWGVLEKGEDNETFKVVNTDERSYGGMGSRLYGNILSVETVHNTVKVYEEWELPSPEYVFGRLIICTDRHLLYYGDLPDRLGADGQYKLPFEAQQSIMTDGFFGRSVIERMIPVQRAFNHGKNRIADHMNRLAIAVPQFEEGSLTDEEEIMAYGIGPGSPVRYRPGRPPLRFLDPPPFPGEIIRNNQDTLDELDRLSGVSQLAKTSAAPGNITAASALAGLQEQDDNRIGLESEEAQYFWTNLVQNMLILYHDNVRYPRIVKSLGKNAEFEISQFIGNDLTSFDVEIMPEPISAGELVQLRQKVIELMNAGMFIDSDTGKVSNEAKAKIFEMMEFGNWEMFAEEGDIHLARAKRENQAMATGEVPIIRQFDDDIVHIGEHNDFRLTAEYESLLEEHPEIDRLYEDHVDDHLKNYGMKVSQQMSPDMTPVDPSMAPAPNAPPDMRYNFSAPR